MADRYVLSEADRNLIREVAREHLSRLLNTAGRNADETLNIADHPAPETYVARVSASGIPALDDGALDGTGTGTGLERDDLVGSAICDVYRIVGYGNSGTFSQITGKSVRVYNLSTTAIAANSWCVVTRDKFGNWLATGSAGTAGTTADSFIVDHVHVVELADTGTGTGTHFPAQWYCEQVTLPSAGGGHLLLIRA